MKLTPIAFGLKWTDPQGRFRTNDNFEIDEADLRDFAQDVLDSGLLNSPNRQAGLLKAFRYLTQAELAANGGYGEAFESLVYATCCIHTRVYVEFYQPDPAVAARFNAVLVAVYDPAAPAAHQVYVDGSFRVGDLVPVRFVLQDDPAARYGYVRPYDVATSWRLGELTIYTENGQTYFARSRKAGLLSQPLSGTDTTDWLREPTPTPTYGLVGRLYQTEAQWQYLLANSRVVPGQPYALEFAGGVLLVDGGQDSDGFAAVGELQLPGQGGASTSQAVQVDVAAGTYRAFSSAFADLLGQPGDNAALAAALHQLSNDTLTQAQRIDAVLQALAPLQADPTTKSYVDNLVQTISTIDANQAAAIQQLQQHLASDDNLLTGLLSTQNTQGQAIAGNTKQLNSNTDLLTAHSQLLQNTLNLTGAQTKSGTVTFLDAVTAYTFITGYLTSKNGQMDFALVNQNGIHMQLRNVLDNNGLLVEAASLPLVDIQLRNSLHYANLRLESRPALMRNGGEDGEIQLRHPTPGSYSSISTFVVSRNYFIVAGKKVGIGVDTPTEALEVNGTAKVSRLFVNGVELTGNGNGGTPYSAGAGMDLTGTVFSTQAGKHRGDYFKGHFGSAKNGQGGFTPPSLGTYFAVPLTVDKDDNGNWDASRNAYRCPVNGLYAIASKGQPGYPSYSSVGNDFYFGPGFNEIAANEDGVWGQVSPSTRGGKPDYTEQYCVAGTFIYPVLCELGASDSNNPNPNNNSTFPAVGGFTVRLIDAY